MQSHWVNDLINYYITDAIDDLHDIVALEIKVWGLQEIDAIPINVLRLCNHTGGVVIAARQSNKLVGFSVGLPAKRNNHWILWSHVTGVHPKYQGKGIGYNLKQHQKKWALANGYTIIGWTFDPLKAANANFNLNRLGAIAHTYHENFYGDMKDAINNHPLPSDRLEAHWDLSHLDNTKNEIAQNTDIAIEIPSNIESLLPHQSQIRIAFQKAFAEGYVAYRFIRDENKQYYLMRKSSRT